jgi:high-affinity Fe2+/Pb2+ permease
MSLILRVVVGLGGEPTWLEFGLWLTYLVVAGWLFFRPYKVAVAQPAPSSNAVAG